MDGASSYFRRIKFIDDKIMGHVVYLIYVLENFVIKAAKFAATS